LTLITGIYGMNFEFMPELTYEFGYFYALGW
jgi:magnesium transporter